VNVRVLTWLSAALAMLGLLVVSGAASAQPIASVQDDQLPNFDGPALEARLDLLAATGAKVTRVDVLWSSVAKRRPARAGDPADPAYDWDRYDEIMRGLAARGIAVMLDFYETPAWASRTKRIGAAPRAADAGRFAGALAGRYSGSFPDPLGGGTLPAARAIEIWNEPNIPRFFQPQCAKRRGQKAEIVSPRIYAAMLAASYSRIKAVSPNAIVVAGVTGPAGSTPRFCERGVATGAIDFIKGLAKERPPYDEFSVHFYPIGLPFQAFFTPSWNALDRVIRAVDRIRPGRPIHVTETGYHTSYNRFHRYFVSEEQQAVSVDQTFQAAARHPRVRIVNWFNMQDNPFWTGGLLRDDLSRKPSWDRFNAVAGAHPPYGPWAS
jgi:hypothetical protein